MSSLVRTLLRTLVALPRRSLAAGLAPLLAAVHLGRAWRERRRCRRYLRRHVGLEVLLCTSERAVEPLVYEHVIPVLPDVALVYVDERRVWTDLPAGVTTELLREQPAEGYPRVARVGAAGAVRWKGLRDDVERCRRTEAPELLGTLAARKLRSLQRVR